MESPISSLLEEELRCAIGEDRFWKNRVNSLWSGERAIHLAILSPPYLDFVLEGKKTVESRFSENQIAPYMAIQSDDIMLLKRPSGPIVGICSVVDAWFYKLDPIVWKEIRSKYFDEIFVNDSIFWASREDASYATLVRVGHPKRINPIPFPKTDRRAWVILKARNQSSLLYFRRRTPNES